MSEVQPPIIEAPATVIPPLGPLSDHAPKMASAENPSREATTTSEEDLKSAAQRRINMVWEYTQMVIALAVVFSAIAYAFIKPGGGTSFFDIAFGTVVGFYFSRTNHARIGDSKTNSSGLDTR